MRKRYVVRYTEGPHAGRYVKLGGGVGGTADLQEAQVVGWSNHSRWQYRMYELVPVEIRLVGDPEPA